ncbi:MAG: hypothetical protein AB1898_11570 [Acidobacteriota bacterium]
MDRESPNMDEQAEGFVRGTLKAEIKKKFPNKERVGCPDQFILKEMAEDPESHTKRFYHVLQCGACVGDFEHYQSAYRRRRYVFKRGLLFAASLLLTLGIWWYVSGRFAEVVHDNGLEQGPEVVPRTAGAPERPKSGEDGQNSGKPSPGKAAANTEAPGGIPESAPPIVHYTMVSPARGPNTESADPKTLTLKRERLQLKIHLPLGSEPGRYEIRLHRQSDKKEKARWEANANKDNGYTLVIKEDFSKLPSDAYLLAVFPPGSTGEVSGHPVKLVDKR